MAQDSKPTRVVGRGQQVAPDKASETACIGCGHEGDHPMIGVTFKDGVAVALPVCATCHRQPPRALGVHFFPKEMKAVALQHAGSSNLGGR